MNHRILVCTEDAVLAKKVRFLLARDECEVEILAQPANLERRLGEGGLSLLIVSRRLGGDDMIETVARWSTEIEVPATLILGGDAEPTPDFISIIPDPIDTQAIYRIASDALAAADAHAQLAVVEEEPGIDDEPAGAGLVPPFPGETNPNIDRTMLSALPPINAQSFGTRGKKDNEEDTGATPLPTREEVDEAIDAGVDDAFLENAADAFASPPELEDLTVEPPHPRRGAPPPPAPPAPARAKEVERPKEKERSAPPPSSPPPAADNLGLSGQLEPAQFAKVVFQCWTMEAEGALVVTGDKETLTIHFEGGQPVHVESNIPGDQIGKILVSKGKLTDKQYSEAAKRAVERGQSIGQAIVGLGYLTREALGLELGEEARERVVSRFAMKTGSFDFEANRPVPTTDRQYKIPVGRILVEGLKQHADDHTLADIVGEVEPRYYKLRSSIDELAKRFPLTDRERDFLRYFGRAYNVADASEVAGLDGRSARIVMALLMTCEEVEDFVPGIQEFEARIKEERERKAAAAVAPPGPPPPAFSPPPPPTPSAASPSPFAAPPIASALPPIPPAPPAPPPPAMPPMIEPKSMFELAARDEDEPEEEETIEPEVVPAKLPPLSPKALFEESGRNGRSAPEVRAPELSPLPPAPPLPAAKVAPPMPPKPAPPPPVAAPTALGGATLIMPGGIQGLAAARSAAAPPILADASETRISPPPVPVRAPAPPPTSAAPGGASIPPMPVPPSGEPGRTPKPVVFGPPLPRGADGSPKEVPERTKSREHFQRGVNLLGQGNFDAAEDSFREAIALCSEEHVYLIGLARALYYNPGYAAEAKIPLLRTIVDRATSLAPDDGRVATLNGWVRHAESQAGAAAAF